MTLENPGAFFSSLENVQSWSSLKDGCGGGTGCGWGLWAALVGTKKDFVLCCHLGPDLLLLLQKLFEECGGEGESLSAQSHQVSVLKPGVVKAVFNSRTGPRVTAQDLFEEQRGTLGHILVQLTHVKLCRLDSGLCLSRVVLCKWQSSTEHDVCYNANAPDVCWWTHHITFQHLRGHVVKCSNAWAVMLEKEWIEVLRTTKINDLNHVHVGDDDVFWFDIQMQNSPAVQIVQTLKNLYNVHHHIIFRVSESVNQTIEELFS